MVKNNQKTNINMKLKNMKTFEQHSSELNISDVIKRLETDDSEIKFGDYFLEVGEYNFIHILKDFSGGDEGYDDYKLQTRLIAACFITAC